MHLLKKKIKVVIMVPKTKTFLAVSEDAGKTWTWGGKAKVYLSPSQCQEFNLSFDYDMQKACDDEQALKLMNKMYPFKVDKSQL